MNFRRILCALLGVLIAGLTLHFAFQGYSSTDALILIRDASKSALLLFLICSLSMAALRATRFSMLLGVRGVAPPWAKVLAITFIRNLCADLLPAKAGSAVVIPLATERLGVSLPKAVTAWSVEYVLDIVVLIPLILVLSPALASAVGVSSSLLMIAACAALLLIVILLVLFKKSFTGVINKYAANFPKLMEGIEYLRTYDTPKLLTSLVLLSLVVRCLKYLGLYFLATALLSPLGFARADLPIGPVTLAAFASEAATSIPGLSIGGFGAPQGVWGMLISQLGAPLTLAVLVGVASYIFTQGYALVLGALALLYLYIPFSIKSKKRILISVTAFLAIILVWISVNWNTNSIQTTAMASSETSQQSYEHTIIADANLGASFGIIRITSQAIPEVLLDTPLHETEPEVSPKGDFIVYSSSRALHRLAPREVWMLELNSKKARRLIENGNYPHVSADGSLVYYQKNRASLWQTEIQSGNAKEFFAPQAELKGRSFVAPRVSPDGKHVAFVSDLPERWWVYVVSLSDGTQTLIANGCQPRWRDNNTLLYVKNEGAKGHAGIAEYSLLDGSSKILVDSERSEYFPSPGFHGWTHYADAPSHAADHVEGQFSMKVRSPQGEVLSVKTPYVSVRWPITLPPSQ